MIKTTSGYKQIDISGVAHVIAGKKELPHTHLGYFHDELGTRKPNVTEWALIDKVKRIWYSRKNKE